MVIVAVPAPSIRAPICTSNWARSMISGSRAALSITVVPRASTAAMRMFSVAPTLGKSRPITAPRSSVAEPTTLPCSMLIDAPIARSPDWCMSSGREPIASPPGRATWACRHRPISGPSTHTDARNRPTAGKSAWNDRSAGVVMTTVSASRVDLGAQAAQHVRHQRHVQDLRAVGDLGRPLGQQRGRHQLEHAVLGPGHPYRAGQARSSGDQEAFHARHCNRHGPTRHELRPAGGRRHGPAESP